MCLRLGRKNKMKIEEIRIYAEVLEQGIDFKEYILKSGITCPIKNIYSKKIHGEIISTDSIITRIRKSKDVDVLITAISSNKEYPLLMIEYSTAVPADDHKMQRSDVYYWGSVYKAPIMKIYPEDKGMNQDFGGGDKITTGDELLLSRRMGAIFYPIEWSVIPGTDMLKTKDNAISCINNTEEIQLIINQLLSVFQAQSKFVDFYLSLFKIPNKKVEQAALKEFNEKRNCKTIITDSTRFKWSGDKLTVKINRFGHAMDPDRGVLFFVNMLVGVESIATEIQVNRSKDFNARGGYKSLFDAAPKEAQMCSFVRNIIQTKNNIFSEEDALHVIKTVWGLPSNFIEKKSNGQYVIPDENLYDFLIKHPSMATKSIFLLSSSLVLTDVYRKPLCTISWGIDPIKKYLKALFNDNYAITEIKPLTIGEAKEDIVTFASVELYKKLKFDLLAVSYPGAQGDRCVLKGSGKKVLRTYIDIIAYEENQRGATVYLEECKDDIKKSYSDAEKLQQLLGDSERMHGLSSLYTKITGRKNTFEVNIGIGAKQANISKPLNVDYIFMFDIDNSKNDSTIIRYNVAIVNTNLVTSFTPLINKTGRLSGAMEIPKIYTIS